jgi:lipid A 4'-phosphatase
LTSRWLLRQDGGFSSPPTSRRKRAVWIGAAFLVLLVLFPPIDLGIASAFYDPAHGFLWRDKPIPEGLHNWINGLSRVLGVVMGLGLVYTLFHSWRERQPVTLLRLGRREWAFLLLGLVLGPGLVANMVLKDHWGRARPVHVEEFGGKEYFSPPLVVSNQCSKNCSFIAGDPAMGFYLQIFAYVVARRFSRKVLAAGMAAGLLAGLLRIGMGAHFFSDVIYAGVFMTLTIAVLHAVMFDTERTTALWRYWTAWLDEGLDERRPA